jgi:hypothetical protein
LSSLLSTSQASRPETSVCGVDDLDHKDARLGRRDNERYKKQLALYFQKFFFRGLCSVYRSEAGGQNIFGSTFSSSLSSSSLASRHETSVRGDNDLDDKDARLGRRDNERYKNNSHWLPSSTTTTLPGKSNYVLYYDAASLYPSSGKFSKKQFFATPPSPFPSGKGKGAWSKKHTRARRIPFPPLPLPSDAPPFPFL